MNRSNRMFLGVAVAAAAVVAAGLGMWWHATAAPGSVPTLAAADDPKPPPKFAEDRDPKPAAPAAAPVAVKFDAERAMGYLKAVCGIGPRVSGTDGMTKLQEMLEKHFTGLGATVARQEFQGRQRSRKAPTPMTNLVVSWHPDRARRVLLSSHYDTRPMADQEPDRRNWNRPFLSANDGTSGVAMFMELAHHMKGLNTVFGVDFVLFDGEEYVFETDRFGGGDQYFLGSEHFADEYARTRDGRKHRYEAGLLFDLFAGKGASLRKEAYSVQLAKPVVDQIWQVAGEVGAKSFRPEKGFERDGGQGVQDDHLPLNRAGIPTADIIDFDYPHWHKLTDTADKISGPQLA